MKYHGKFYKSTLEQNFVQLAIKTGIFNNYKQLVPIKSVTAGEMAAAGKIDICAYHSPPVEDSTKLVYKKLKELKVHDATANLELLWKVTLQLLRSPQPGWAGATQGL